jgi:hypothetical protein
MDVPQPMITLRDEAGQPVTVTLQAAWTAMMQHLLELRRDVVALQLDMVRLTTPEEKRN